MGVRNRIAAAVSLASLATGAAFAQQAAAPPPAPAPVEIRTTQLADGLYLIEGQGGNITASIGADGVFMVDDQFAPVSGQIMEAIAALTDQPVRFVVNTHHHGDHNGGNANFAAAGATIIATAEARDRIRAGFETPATGDPQPVPAGALPALTYTGELTFHFNGETIRVIELESAHTDGDSVVWFENAKVLATGDTFRTTSYQGADTAGGGSVSGIVANYQNWLERFPADARLMPGHGVISPISALGEQIAMIEAVRAPVAAAKAEGKSLEEVLAMNLSAEYDERWSSGRYNGEYLVTTLYQEAE